MPNHQGTPDEKSRQFLASVAEGVWGKVDKATRVFQST